MGDDHPAQAGFTLTELLVSLAILAFVSLLLMQSFSASGNIWRRGAGSAAVAETIQGAQELLRYRIAYAYPETAIDAIPPYAFFDGRDSALIFFGPPPDNHSSNEIRYYTLSVTTGGDLQLISGLSRSRTDKSPPLTETLLHGVQSLDLSYFDPAPGRNHGWQSSWHLRAQPPALVRLQVNFLPGDHRWWPELLVHPIATIDRNCILSRNTHRCAGRA
jgi:general secretion pathway protein J